MFSAALASVFALVASQNVDAGLVGCVLFLPSSSSLFPRLSSLSLPINSLILSYALSVPNTLNWLVRSASEVENNIVSVERLVATRSLAPEAPDEIEETKPSAAWPEEVSTSYLLPVTPSLVLTLRFSSHFRELSNSVHRVLSSSPLSRSKTS